MANFEPRPIIINSKNLPDYQFLSGFITFDNDNENSVGKATLEPQYGDVEPNLLYVEDTKVKIEGAIKPLTVFEFILNQPVKFTVQFEDSKGVKKTKVKTSSNLGHQQPIDPMLYVPRPFIMQDESVNDNNALIYGFLIDTHDDDKINYDGVSSVTINLGKGTKDVTQIYIFDINKEFESIELYLSNNTDPITTMDFTNAPVFLYQPYKEGAETKPNVL
jgi:hypothetical protein